MKKIVHLFIVCALVTSPYLSTAQNVKASVIAQKILNGDDVSYHDVTIIGDLDLTPFKSDQPKESSSFWWSGSTNTIDHTITAKIEFINCLFEGDVLAYIHDDKSENTYVAHFNKQSVFQNCTFKKDIQFKHSKFEKTVDFSNAEINGISNFKYAEFNEMANFSKINFNELANFKYAEMKEWVDFSYTSFNEIADFKYAEIEEGVNFTNAQFNDFLNFKYVALEGDVKLKDMKVNSSIDTKYGEINGEDLTNYLASAR